MKKVIASIVACLACSQVMTAQTLSVADVYTVQGSTATFGITIDAGQKKFKGFQFSATFPTTGFSMVTQPKNNVNEHWDGTISVSKKLTAKGKATILGYALEDEIPDGRIVIGTVNFGVDANLAVGDYEVKLSGIKLSGTDKATPADQSFTVHVVDHPTLDENSTVAPQATESESKVTVKRTISGGSWGTICLPFSIDENQLTEVFGDGVEIAEFTEWKKESDGTVSLTFTNGVKAMKANSPYLIKTTSDISQFTLESVQVSPDPKSAITEVKSTDGKASFIGNYVAGTLIPRNNLFLNGGKLYYSVGTSKIAAYRGYFALPDGIAFSSSSRLKISIGHENTAIEDNSLKNSGVQTIVYDLKGSRTDMPARGLYIVDGKKQVFK